MAVKKTDLEKNKGLKIANSLKQASAARGGIPGGAGARPDRREQRRLDQEQGLVPFACKLDGTLAQRLQALAVNHPGGMTGLLNELLAGALPPEQDQA
ncbi:hypothetical protein [Cupriavidus oxalaticus]|uniref:hypothetical protein n=1 Tax=Cupriavidus oxalaticus TaxID=96344 RepID=UPI00142EA7F3|nr:hypothetical protein [Cupriavidus oxalaticus]